MKIDLDNVKGKIEYNNESIEFAEYMNKKIYETLSPFDPDRFNARAYRLHAWDGRVAMYNTKTQEFSSGLMFKVEKLIKEEKSRHPELNVTISDLRGDKVAPEHETLPEPYTLPDSKMGTISLRKHQVDSVNFAFKHQVGVVNGATNSGKTEIASAIIKESLHALASDEKVFFMCNNKVIANQSRKRISERLNMPVGLWGDGKKELEQVTVAMVGTLNSALKDPSDGVKLTNEKDKTLKHFALEVAPKFVTGENQRIRIKTYLLNNKPKTSYDRNISSDLRDMLSSNISDKKIAKAMQWEIDAYNKLLRKKNKKSFDKYEEAKNILDGVKILIIDEAHHAASNMYQKVVSNLTHARMKIGLTGTVPNGTGKEVKYGYFQGIFGNEMIVTKNIDLINKGYSAKPTIILLPVTKPNNLAEIIDSKMPKDANKRQTALMDYQIAYRYGVIENGYRNNLLALTAKKLLDSGEGAMIIVVNSIEHGEIIKDHLDKLDITTEFMTSSDTSEDREAIIKRVKSGETQVLIGTQLIDEGLDVPDLKFMIYASAGKSVRQLLQRVGRMLRVSAKKKTALIIDMQDRTYPILYKQAKERAKAYKEEQFEVKG